MSSKSSDKTSQNDLQTEDENISEITPLLNNTACTPKISNENNVSRKEDKQIKRVEAELAAVKVTGSGKLLIRTAKLSSCRILS